MKANKIIEAKDISKSYGEGEGTTYALKGVTFDIYEGEFLMVLGSSGSGKSTLLNVLGGMDRVSGGALLFKGQDITKYKQSELNDYRRHKIGFIFQSFNLLNELTAIQNVALTPNGNNKRKALELLESVGLKDKADHFPSQLSGGQQQRVAIARALNKDFDLLLCDEPTGSLDEASGKAILSLLKEVNELGKTIVLVTHNRDIVSLATRVITLKDGQIESDISR